MKFDYCIGNPPYQETKGETKNVGVWSQFVEVATDIADNVCMIHPGRWVIPKKQMETIHDNIIDSGLTLFDYYPDASKVFNGVSIDGGVTITNFKKDYDGNVNYYNNGVLFGVYNDDEQFFSNKFEEEAHNKIFGSFSKDVKTIQDRLIGNIGSLGGAEYGYNKSKHIDKLVDSPAGLTKPVKIWANNGYGKGTRFAWHYIEEAELSNIPQDLIKTRKVMLDKKGHSISSGSGNIINNIPQIVIASAIASGDVLFVLPEENSDYHLNLIKSLFMTRTARFLMSITQKDLFVRGFENIPDYTLFIPMLNGKLFTDEWFYKKFNFSDNLINHINAHISEKKEMR